MENLSPNFTYEEFIRSETAERNGIDNTPTAKQLENGIWLCENVLEPFRQFVWDETGQEHALMTSSFFRCEALNIKLGSHKNSDHGRGLAWDGTIQRMTAAESYEWWARWIARTGVPYNQILFEFRWVHVGFGPSMRHQLRHFKP